MAITLREELAEAEARAARLRQRIASESCVIAGHDWRQIGGRACCCAGRPECSFPVHECTVCGDCDYGDNPEADQIKGRCAALTQEPDQ